MTTTNQSPHEFEGPDRRRIMLGATVALAAGLLATGGRAGEARAAEPGGHRLCHGRRAAGLLRFHGGPLGPRVRSC